MIELTDEDILPRLKNFEDSFVERKTKSDLGDCLKTAVAFANTVPLGYPAILFAGVKDNGEPEDGLNLENIQRTVSEKIANAYPPIYYLTRVLQSEGRQFLAVIIPGSETRPHFAGHAYVREGPKLLTLPNNNLRVLSRSVVARCAKSEGGGERL